jgi:hypothetical protein
MSGDLIAGAVVLMWVGMDGVYKARSDLQDICQSTQLRSKTL